MNISFRSKTKHVLKKVYIILFVLSWILLALYFTTDFFGNKIEEEEPPIEMVKPIRDSVITDTVYIKVKCDSASCDTIEPKKSTKKLKKYKYYRKPKRKGKLVMNKVNFLFWFHKKELHLHNFKIKNI